MIGTKVTPAMCRALDVLVEVGGVASYSNLTARGSRDADGTEHGPSVYWQSADRLAAIGFVEIYGVAPSGRVLLTKTGRDWMEDR